MIIVFVLTLFVMLLAIVYFWYPVKNEPAGFEVFTDHYLEIMKNLNSSETKSKIASQLDPSYNQTDLFVWEQSRLTFTQNPTGWFEDPTKILNSGKGICVQFSIVYVSACLALNYPSRLVVAADTTSWNFIHVWVEDYFEDYFNGSWVHVDPSDKVWNNPSRYQSWDWGKGIGSDVKIYAFEDGIFEEVTATYSSH
jgi:hypothetical protein